MTAGTITSNWVFDSKEPRDFANRALRKANEMEESKLKNGWRWKKVHDSLSLLVPCDENGNPTEHGEKIIERYRHTLGLV